MITRKKLKLVLIKFSSREKVLLTVMSREMIQECSQLAGGVKILVVVIKGDLDVVVRVLVGYITNVVCVASSQSRHDVVTDVHLMGHSISDDS